MAKTTNKPIPKTTVGKGKNYKPTEQGAGMTAKGRAEYNAKNNSNLKAPAPNPKTKADSSQKKFLREDERDARADEGRKRAPDEEGCEP